MNGLIYQNLTDPEIEAIFKTSSDKPHDNPRRVDFGRAVEAEVISRIGRLNRPPTVEIVDIARPWTFAELKRWSGETGADGWHEIRARLSAEVLRLTEALQLLRLSSGEEE